ncbi:TrkA family potassium uptake protein [Pyrococcus furiosus DSM 3638]|uniref:TrkA family potassium uptake protein n=3 Tax=Pyrococcus furiosus TaxID=2261 RepID=A0A5C0XMK0_PYRFU|nr:MULTISPECIES: TrkA family potassium uptake protein [Pyrococcus]AAL80299.1 trk system potassium uptake protein a homolog [Pyrococcus furiosus DSM 3638]AFN04401.1 trk system potassium uptake - like protein [Pyrococcus furiosus COM1]MDK2869939.1 trk/ktr system potassium uptake protein [Pyrococcus sp.]QEK77902.1 TrkA family potassium uptake protein [Pyrococcus furiosus DSM 3638]
MYVIIMGAGRIGTLVAKMLENSGHDVAIIEMNKDRARAVSDIVSGLVIEGDATDQNILESANVRNADAFVALTGKDDANILACILAKHLNPRIMTILRITDPRKKKIFEEVKDLKKYFDVVVSPEDIAANYIFRVVITPGFDRVLLPREGAEIIQFHIDENSKVAGKAVKDLNLPRDSLIIAIYDEKGNLIIPSGETILPKRGTVVVFAKDSALKEIKKIMEEKVEESEE